MGKEYDIYCEFDIAEHKKKYTNYLEVLIEPSGKIVYAVPSRQEKAMALACEKLGKTRDEINAMCPREYYFDFLNWLLMLSGAVAVWNDFFAAPQELTRKQVGALRKLKMAGLYNGIVPFISKKK